MLTFDFLPETDLEVTTELFVTLEQLCVFFLYLYQYVCMLVFLVFVKIKSNKTYCIINQKKKKERE